LFVSCLSVTRHQPNVCRSKYGMDRIAIGQIYLPKFTFILQRLEV
jgi:hypothetical protein